MYRAVLAAAKAIAGSKYLVVHFIVPDQQYVIGYATDETAQTVRVHPLADDVKAHYTLVPTDDPGLQRITVHQSDGPALYQFALPGDETEWQLLVAAEVAPGDQHAVAERSFKTRRVIWRVVQQTGYPADAIRQALKAMITMGNLKVHALDEAQQVVLGVAAVKLAALLLAQHQQQATGHAKLLRRAILAGTGHVARAQYPHLSTFDDAALLGVASAATKLLLL